MKCIVKKGPFAGAEVRLSDLVTTAEEGGQAALLWPVVLRHALFVATFPPQEGYAVTITVAEGGLQQTFDAAGTPYQDADGQPIKAEAKIFTATLTKDGQAIAQASTLQTMEVRKAWEIGENNAKSRLYESMGLPAAFRQHDIVHDDTKPPESDTSRSAAETIKTSTVVQSLGVRAVPASVKAVTTTPEAPVSVESDTAPSNSTQRVVAPTRPAGVNASMWAQLQQACARKGVPMPEVSSNEEAAVRLSEVKNG